MADLVGEQGARPWWNMDLRVLPMAMIWGSQLQTWPNGLSSERLLPGRMLGSGSEASDTDDNVLCLRGQMSLIGNSMHPAQLSAWICHNSI